MPFLAQYSLLMLHEQNINRLREKHSSEVNSHNKWRHKLDMQVLEIEELKAALDDQYNQLQRVQQEKEKVWSEKDGVASTVAALQADLKRVRKDAEAFGRDLKILHKEKDKLEGKLKDEVAKGDRARKQAQRQIQLLNEQLSTQKQRTAKALQVYENHVCARFVSLTPLHTLCD